MYEDMVDTLMCFSCVCKVDSFAMMVRIKHIIDAILIMARANRHFMPMQGAGYLESLSLVSQLTIPFHCDHRIIRSILNLR